MKHIEIKILSLWLDEWCTCIEFTQIPSIHLYFHHQNCCALDQQVFFHLTTYLALATATCWLHLQSSYRCVMLDKTTCKQSCEIGSDGCIISLYTTASHIHIIANKNDVTSITLRIQHYSVSIFSILMNVVYDKKYYLCMLHK